MDENLSATLSRRPEARARPLNLPFLPARILVKEVNWLGDLVISLPALRAVRAAYPMSKIAVMVKRELAPFFDGLGWVDEVMPYEIARGVGGVLDRLRAVHQIR